MPFDVQQFRSSLVADGARPSLFDVSLVFPGLATAGLTAANPAASTPEQQVTFKARATSLPGDSINSITVNYFGREIKVAGTRSFPDWTITVINDEDFIIRNAFEKWMSRMNEHVANVRNGSFLKGDGGYQTTVSVKQYSKTGAAQGPTLQSPVITGVIKRYDLIGAFPVEVSPIELDWASGDAIEEFTVTFAYQWWESLSPIPTTDASSSTTVVVPGI